MESWSGSAYFSGRERNGTPSSVTVGIQFEGLFSRVAYSHRMAFSLLMIVLINKTKQIKRIKGIVCKGVKNMNKTLMIE